MRPASEAFLRAVRSSHTMRARARLVPAGQTGIDPAGIETPVLDGFVTLDAAAAVRSACELTTARPWPDSVSDPAAPYGQELFLERGLEFGNGSTEWVSLGYFRLNDTEQADAPAGALHIAAADRMAGIVDGRLTRPVQFPATTTRAAVLDQLVTEVYPAAVIEWDDDAGTVPIGRQLVAEEDRHGFLADVVTSAGKTWFWDYRGVLVIRTAPDPADPVTELDGGEGGVLVSLARSISRAGVYNGVVAAGEAPDTEAPVWALVVDDNPDSATWWDGPFGPVPRFYSSPLLTTTAQAEAAARSMLAGALGVPYNVDLSAVPNPALEPLDPVRVTYPATLTTGPRRELHVLESLTIPLIASAPLEATTREQTLTTLGVR